MPLTLDLKQDYSEPVTAEYAVDSAMFEAMEKSLVKGGNLTARVTTQRTPEGLQLTVCTRGKVVVECDRCLDDMEVDIDTRDTVSVQSGDRYEDAADIIYVDKSHEVLDLWPMVYDFIVLALPISHVHPEGQCNKDMTERLNLYMVRQADEEQEY